VGLLGKVRDPKKKPGEMPTDIDNFYPGGWIVTKIVTVVFS